VNEISTSELIKRFQRLAGRLESKHAVLLQLALVRGRRWSYLAGRMPAPGLSPVSERVKLGPGLGLVVYGLDELRPVERLQVLKAIGDSFAPEAGRAVDR